MQGFGMRRCQWGGSMSGSGQVSERSQGALGAPTMCSSPTHTLNLHRIYVTSRSSDWDSSFHSSEAAESCFPRSSSNREAQSRCYRFRHAVHCESILRYIHAHVMSKEQHILPQACHGAIRMRQDVIMELGDESVSRQTTIVVEQEL